MIVLMCHGEILLSVDGWPLLFQRSVGLYFIFILLLFYFSSQYSKS